MVRFAVWEGWWLTIVEMEFAVAGGASHDLEEKDKVCLGHQGAWDTFEGR